MGKTMTIKLDDKTKEFYHNMFLARKLQTWCESWRLLHSIEFDDDIEDVSDEEILKKLSDEEYAKSYLSAAEYEEYLKYYNDVYTRG